MISADQPNIFPSDVLVRFSSRENGSILQREQGRHSTEAVQNRQRLMQSLKLDYKNTVYQAISYNAGATYRTLAIVDQRNTTQFNADIVSDALITDQPDVALFLPVADCVATALYDPRKKVLAMLHLGRHSTVTDLVPRVVATMQNFYGSNSAEILAYLSPAAQKESYKLAYFDQIHEDKWQQFAEQRDDGIYVDLPGYNRQALLQAGLLPHNLEVSSVDTCTNENYFSHSRGDKNGRQALIAMMR